MKIYPKSAQGKRLIECEIFSSSLNERVATITHNHFIRFDFINNIEGLSMHLKVLFYSNHKIKTSTHSLKIALFMVLVKQKPQEAKWFDRVSCKSVKSHNQKQEANYDFLKCEMKWTNENVIWILLPYPNIQKYLAHSHSRVHIWCHRVSPNLPPQREAQISKANALYDWLETHLGKGLFFAF